MRGRATEQNREGRWQQSCFFKAPTHQTDHKDRLLRCFVCCCQPKSGTVHTVNTTAGDQQADLDLLCLCKGKPLSTEIPNIVIKQHFVNPLSLTQPLLADDISILKKVTKGTSERAKEKNKEEPCKMCVIVETMVAGLGGFFTLFSCPFRVLVCLPEQPNQRAFSH